MTSWADYAISSISYNIARTEIQYATIHSASGEIGRGIEYRREIVIQAIERGLSFVTIIRACENWRKGAFVRLIVVDGSQFLTTDEGISPSNQPRDQVDLPEFQMLE